MRILFWLDTCVEDRPLVVCFPNLFRYCSKSEGDGRRGLEAGCRLKVQVLWGLVCRRHLAEQEAMHIQAMLRLIINSVCMPVEGLIGDSGQEEVAVTLQLIHFFSTIGGGEGEPLPRPLATLWKILNSSKSDLFW